MMCVHECGCVWPGDNVWELILSDFEFQGLNLAHQACEVKIPNY